VGRCTERLPFYPGARTPAKPGRDRQETFPIGLARAGHPRHIGDHNARPGKKKERSTLQSQLRRDAAGTGARRQCGDSDGYNGLRAVWAMAVPPIEKYWRRGANARHESVEGPLGNWCGCESGGRGILIGLGREMPLGREDGSGAARILHILVWVLVACLLDGFSTIGCIVYAGERFGGLRSVVGGTSAHSARVSSC
jgi:hypothetical protein